MRPSTGLPCRFSQKGSKIVILNKIYPEYFSKDGHTTWLNELLYSELSNTIQVREY